MTEVVAIVVPESDEEEVLAAMVAVTEVQIPSTFSYPSKQMLHWLRDVAPMVLVEP